MKRVLWALVAGIVIGALVSCSNPMWGGGGSPSPAPSNDIASWFEGIYLDLLDRERNGTMGAVANCQFVCDAINAKWNKSIAPVPGTELQPANCKYLLSMIDQYVNDGISSYGTSSFATEQIIDTAACDLTIGRLAAPFLAQKGIFNTSTGNTIYGFLAYSPDGASWQAIDSYENDRAWYKGAYGNGKYALISQNRAATTQYSKTSADCITWTSPRALPATLGSANIGFGNGVFVITGRQGTDLQALRSTDGLNWSYISLGNYALRPTNEVLFGNGKFLFFAQSSVSPYPFIAFHSTDGQNWNQTILPNSFQAISSYFFGGRFIAVSRTGAATSIDGINWTIALLYPVVTRIDWLSYSGGEYIIYAMQTNGIFHIYTSTDAINWVDKGPTTSPIGTSNDEAAYGNGIIVSFRATPPRHSLDNGITWQSGVGAYGASTGMFSKGRFVIFSNASGSTKAGYSLDGINWTEASMPAAPNQSNINWHPILIKGL